MREDAGLHINAVSHAFGDVLAVNNVTLTVDRGQIHCLLGPSGSGKSTLLRIIAGLERQQSGTIAIDGETVSGPGRHLPAEERSIGFVFQDYALFPHLNALENVLFGMPKRRSRNSRAEAARLLCVVGLADRLTAMPHTLSGGEQQRVALARALARAPRVMLLDEPFSGLDARLRGDVRATTLQVLRAANVMTLMVTHDPAEALSCADGVSVMDRGTLLQTDEPHRIYHSPADRRAAEAFGLINQIPAVLEDGRLRTPYGDLPAVANLRERPSILYLRPEQFVFDLSTTVESPSLGRIERIIPEGATSLYVVRTADNSTVFVRTLSTATVPLEVEHPVTLRLRDANESSSTAGRVIAAHETPPRDSCR